MDWLNLLYDVLKLCVIPLAGILTTYVVKWLKAKEIEALNKIDNDTADKYISMFFNTISTCVTATTQTYVESLKKQNAFTEEAQKTALEMTFTAVKAALTEDAKEYLASIYGDLNKFILTSIEAEVKYQKD